MSYGNWLPAYCEQLHGYIFDEFHAYRKEHNLDISFVIDGTILSHIIAKAKLKLYKERPEAEKSGFEDLDKKLTPNQPIQ